MPFLKPPLKHCPSPLHRFIKGFIYRHQPRCPENEYFLDYVRYSFLMKLQRSLPKSVLDKNWPTPPPALAEVHTRSLMIMTETRTQALTMIWPWTFCQIFFFFSFKQASEHLRKMCMQNMVWKYCKSISPEWKHQVSWSENKWLKIGIHTRPSSILSSSC